MLACSLQSSVFGLCIIELYHLINIKIELWNLKNLLRKIKNDF